MPLGKGGHLNWEDIDTKEQIGPKSTFIDPCLDVLVCGTNKTKIHLDLIITTNALNGAVFQHA